MECEARSREIERINRALRMHKDCIQEVMRAESEEELLESVKRVMVEVGGYRQVLSLSSKSCPQFQFEEHCPCGVLCGVLRGALETGKGVEVKGTEEKCSCCSLYPDPKDRCRLLAVPIKVRGECEYILAACGDAESGEFVSEEIALMEELAGDLSFGIEVLRLREERKKAMESLRYASFHDPLTGLYNRAFFMEELHRLDVERQLPLSVVFADVDGLKLVNDTFGHAEGDKFLINFAQVLKRCLRSSDIVSRIGGDEFAVLLPKTNNETARNIVRRIEDALENLSFGPITVSASFGVATKEDPSQGIEVVFSEAEKEMYRVKVGSSSSLKKNVLEFLYNWRRSSPGYDWDNARLLLALSQKVGKAMQLKTKDLERLYLLALFHDIGFVAMPEIIENANIGRLADEEFRRYAEHVEIGYRIALNLPELAPIAKDILLHHEQWDGKGFPQGLKGEEIPLLARILAPVHEYCDDIFIKGLSKKEAISAVVIESGKSFDPYVVDVFLNVLSKDVSKDIPVEVKSDDDFKEYWKGSKEGT
ncbi:MAG TPA: diguanylate cyclase [Thermosynergistes sp.]|nr:diguanylate cyclase [Thermosynergistes sp.]